MANTDPSRLFFRRGDRLRRMLTSGFRSSGDESTLDDDTAPVSSRVGRTFLIGLGRSCDVTTTSHTGDLTSTEAGDDRSTVHCSAAAESTDVLRRFSSMDAISDDDTAPAGCCVGEVATSLLSGRLNERGQSLRSATTAVITRHFANTSYRLIGLFFCSRNTLGQIPQTLTLTLQCPVTLLAGPQEGYLTWKDSCISNPKWHYVE